MPPNEFKRRSYRIIVAVGNNPLRSGVEAGFERDKAKVWELRYGTFSTILVRSNEGLEDKVQKQGFKAYSRERTDRP